MFCKKSLGIFVLVLLCSFTVVADNGNPSLLSIACKQYIDSLPLSRSTSFGEEQIVNGNYQGLGQQYNNISGTIKSVLFAARSNPASSSSTSSVKVVIYNANQGLPGTILATNNIVIDSASVCSFYELVLPTPLNVNGSIIISLEPLIPSTDNFFVQRNTPPDGQNLNLIKIKQANQWFKNLGAGDPAFDFDFMILPMKEVVITPNFTFNANALQVAFTNTSSLTTTNFEWDFGDGNTSIQTSPTHQYAASGNYQVKLKMSYNGYQVCEDSVIKPVNVSAVGLSNLERPINVKWTYLSDYQQLKFNSTEKLKVRISDLSGRVINEIELAPGVNSIVDCSAWVDAIYIISSENNLIDKFLKD